uniref:Uncharacterized protein n=1 Tax=Megaselia scalaris TaxID=36166 RepID=T1H4C1_MEGSC
MKSFIVLACCLAMVASAPVADNSGVEIVRSDASVEPEGFNFVYELSDGTSHQEEGHLINTGSENAAIAVKGSY